MASVGSLKWIDRLIWTLIYGGLLAAIIGYATQRTDPVTGWSVLVAGAIAAASGFVLIWVRSRLREPATTPAKETP